MQVTVTLPDEFAAQVQARGLTPESYIEGLIEDAVHSESVQNAQQRTIAEAIGRIRELRKGNTLGDLRIKDLIHEGHPY